MKKILKASIPVIAALLIAAAMPSLASDITFLTHSVGDSAFKDDKGLWRGKRHGGRRAFNIEVIRAMMKLTKQPSTLSVYPFKRALSLVQNRDNYAVFNLNRSPAREASVKWVGPIQHSVTYFYELKTRPSGIKNLEDAKQVERICVLNGNVHHRLLEASGFENINPNISYRGCTEMLTLKRVDLIPMSNISSALRHPRYQNLLQRTPVKLSDSFGYLAFSKNLSNAEIAQWQAALDQLKLNGTYQKLEQNYLHENSHLAAK